MSPRLSVGEIAPGIKRKKEKNQGKIKQIINALNEAKNNPSIADKDILDAARTQAGLEKLCIPERDFHSISPNAFKSNCQDVLLGGFKEFKKLREEAYRVYLKHQNICVVPRANTKAALSGQLQRLRDENAALLDSFAEFSFMYMDLFRVVKDWAGLNDTVRKKLEEHVVRFRKARSGLRLVVDNEQH